MWLLSVLALAGSGAAAAPAQPASFGEYEIKAALVFKLAKFVEWPAEAFADHSDRHTLCVAGRGPMASMLERKLRGKSIRGRQIVVHKNWKVEELPTCQVVFTNSSDGGELSEIAAALEGRPTLLVGEAPCFAQRGGMVNFFVENARVRFEINPKQAERAGLVINPNLLSLARIVAPDEECADAAPHP